MTKALNLQKKGRLGEQLAVKYLLGKGFCIIAQNCRVGRYEIDIIASQNDKLYFFEVKSSFNEENFNPIKRIEKTKISHLYKAAYAYQRKNKVEGEFVIEGISVLVNRAHKKATIERFDLSINGGNL